MASINSGRRNHLEIIASILDACRCGTRKTNVMSQCNLSYWQFERYLDMLLKANLLSIENDCRPLLLRVSGKGKDFVEIFSSVKAMLEYPPETRRARWE